MTKRKLNSLNENKRKRLRIENKSINHSRIWDKINNCLPFRGIRNKYINEWVSPSSIRNYTINDPLLDWLDMYYTKNNNKTRNRKRIKIKKNKKELNILFKNGIIFENKIFDILKNKFNDNFVKVVKESNQVSEKNYNLTLDYMKKGVPIIAQAVLLNKINKTRGIADLLIRSDYLNKIFRLPQISQENINIMAPKLGINYHYRVIDIKWTTLHLCSNGFNIRNDNRVPAYKCQLAIYNCALGNMQGYYPDKAYILGNSWNYEKNKEKYYGNSCFDLLGHIDYNNFDNKFIDLTIDGINWIRKLRRYGQNWKINPPSVPELYPNMVNTQDFPWSEVKKKVADDIDELTKLWMVGPKNRKIGHINNIYKWSDNNCESSKLGIKGEKVSKLLDEIIKINRSNDEIIKPQIIKNNLNNWKSETELDFYIDFETLNTCFMSDEINVLSNSNNNIIFMIGVGYVSNNKWNFKLFKMDNLTYNDEEKVIEEWKEFIDERIKEYKLVNNINEKRLIKPRFFHWSNAEVTSINSTNSKHYNKWGSWLKQIEWVDLYKIFKSEPILIKGSFNFGLKNIVKAMYKNKLIKTKWDNNGITNGLFAMTNAIKYYISKRNNKECEDIMYNIEKYNEIDCKVLWEITDYLRKNHI
jgi:hypothetical protein